MRLKKKTSCGAWVVEGDTHVGKWIEETGRLDHDQWLLHRILHRVPLGGTVVDAGALYGDHTLAYARAVGIGGNVYAFEPNPVACSCLRRNMWHFDMAQRVSCFQVALSDDYGSVKYAESKNTGASRISENGTKYIPCIPLDALRLSGVSFMKFDVEGYEVRALRGAKTTILKYRPYLVCEVNGGALNEQGFTFMDLMDFFDEVNYVMTSVQHPAQDIHQISEAQFDVLCEPEELVKQ